MSHNQPRTERKESTQYRKTGRSGSFNQPRQFAGGTSTKGGGGLSSTTSNPSNRSFNKKYNSNAQGQPMPRSPNVSSDSSNLSAAPPAVQNGVPQLTSITTTSGTVKPTVGQDKKFVAAVTKAVSSNIPSAAQPSNVSSSSESKAPTTPAKVPGNASGSFSLQFGSISPGFMNGVQIPAGTSSAPLDLDEQRKAQVEVKSTIPPSLPSQLPQNDVSNKGIASKSLPTQGSSVTQPNLETMVGKEKGETVLSESLKPDRQDLEASLKSLTLESPEILAKSEESTGKEVTSTNAGDLLENTSQKLQESDSVKVADDLDASSREAGGDNNDESMPASGSFAQNDETAPVSVTSTPNGENENKVLPDTSNVAKAAVPRGKKKKKWNKFQGTGLSEEDKWNKFQGQPMAGRGDMRADFGYRANVGGLRSGQGGNYGVLRNPRAPAPHQYVGPTLSGPGLQRNNSDSDRWQCGGNFQKGLMPSPQGPVIHRAEKKYEIGKVTDEEQAKQRQLKGILNKLTPQNFEKLFQQVKQLNIDNVVTLVGVTSQIFDKALTEPTLYANFCFHLSAYLPDLSVDNEKITFKRLLLNKCQEEFERGEREEKETNKAEAEGESKQTAEEREEKRLQVRRRMLGNIRLIGELYKKRMLTERIMHECINKLLGQHENPDEENIEALCKLMSTIGEMIDHPRAKEHMDYYFEVMLQLSNNMKLSSRVWFMLKDAIDLRRNKWQQRRNVEGPIKIEEVHRDAAQERHDQSTRMARGPSFYGSARRPPPMDFGPRTPNTLPSPTSHMGVFRPVSPHMRVFHPISPHMRGYNNSQDATYARLQQFARRAYRGETFVGEQDYVPLTERPMGDYSITLGPQGGLARGMAFRGQTSTHNVPMGHGPNGFSSVPERAAYARYGPPIYEQSRPLEQYGNRAASNMGIASPCVFVFLFLFLVFLVSLIIFLFYKSSLHYS